MTMKYSAIGALALALSASVYAAPLEKYTTPSDSQGGFMGIDAGAFWLQDFSISSSPSVDFKFKTGWGVTVPFGYDFGNGFMVSASVGYSESRIDGVIGSASGHSQTAQVNGGFDFVPIMANVGYKVRLGGGFNWYVGAGAGGVYSKGTFGAYDDPANRSITYGQLGETAIFDGLSDSKWSFGFTAFTGISFDISSSTSLNLGYRYLWINDTVSVNGQAGSDFSGHTVELGLLWRL
jgi:opacity protein-like surface antigen